MAFLPFFNSFLFRIEILPSVLPPDACQGETVLVHQLVSVSILHNLISRGFSPYANYPKQKAININPLELYKKKKHLDIAIYSDNIAL